MMLRCSYICSVVGVAFVNIIPVGVRGMARRVRGARYFSQWLGEIIGIHQTFGFKIKVVIMGEFALTP